VAVASDGLYATRGNRHMKNQLNAFRHSATLTNVICTDSHITYNIKRTITMVS